ncbi:MAG: DUF3090 domain-containing protein [Ardenticatenaceae bacterium]|nr:DUF3090 domain-containing protein [Ardenticatenaceae bacterium]
MAETYELNPASRITVGTIGQPGQRTFFLQGAEGLDVISLVIEKEQAQALAVALDQLLDELENRYDLPPARAETISGTDLVLETPSEALFRVGQLGLGYDETTDQVMVAAQELLPEDEPLEPRIVRMWGTRAQMAALSRHAIDVVKGGRPICSLCGKPIDPEGHFCPRSNGHAHD